MANNSRYFLDTSYIMGLYNRTDQHHQVCVDAYTKIKDSQQLYITDVVLMEIGNVFSSINLRAKGGEIIDRFLKSSNVYVINLTQEYFHESFERYYKIMDKEWGMVDCYSFVVMEKNDIRYAVTTDHHFKQAGFLILPF